MGKEVGADTTIHAAEEEALAVVRLFEKISLRMSW